MERRLNNTARKRYDFSELNGLCIYDLKAQKKTMSMKRFQNLPLNDHELMELRFNRTGGEDQQQQDGELYQTSFRIRIGKKYKEKMLSRLSNPKYNTQSVGDLSMGDIS